MHFALTTAIEQSSLPTANKAVPVSIVNINIHCQGVN